MSAQNHTKIFSYQIISIYVTLILLQIPSRLMMKDTTWEHNHVVECAV